MSTVVLLVLLAAAASAQQCSQLPEPAGRTSCSLKADVVLVWDDSGSMDDGEFNTLKTYFQALTATWNINPHMIRVGVVWFSDTSGVDFRADQHTTETDLFNAIGDLRRHRQSATCLACGIDEATQIGGLREDGEGIPRVMIIITDGRSNAGGDVETSAFVARRRGWDIFAIGVGVTGSARDTVNEISSVKNLIVENFAALGSISSFSIGEEFCETVCSTPCIDNSDSDFMCDNTPAGQPCSIGAGTVITCTDGYEIKDLGLAVPVCLDDGTWQQPLPECAEIPKCLAPVVPNSNAGSQCSGKRRGESCQFTCFGGYEIEFGPGEMRCNEFGEWAYISSCVKVGFAIEFEPPVPEDDPSSRLNQEVQQKLFSEMRYAVCVALFAGDAGKCADVQLPSAGSINDPYDFDSIPITPSGSEPGATAQSDVDVCEDEADVDDCVPCAPGESNCYRYVPDGFLTLLQYCQLPTTHSSSGIVEDHCPDLCGICPAADPVIPVQAAQQTFATPEAKIFRLDQQPFHKNLKSFFQSYEELVRTGLIIPDLTDAENLRIQNALAEIERVALQKLDYLSPFESRFGCGDNCENDVPFQNFIESTGLSVTLDVFNQQIGLQNDIIEQIVDDPAKRLINKLELAYEDYGTLTIDETLTIESLRPDWIAVPTTKQIQDSPAVGSLNYSFTINAQTTVTSNIRVEATSGLVAEVNGEYSVLSFFEEDYKFDIDIYIGKAAAVTVRPGDWYDDSWQSVVRTHRNPNYVLSADDLVDPDKQVVVFGDGGDSGLMNSLIRQLIVVEEMYIVAKMDIKLTERDKYIWSSATSTRTPYGCTGTSGKACVTPGTTFIGTNAPANGGMNTQGLQGGWQYMKLLLEHFYNNIDQRDGSDGLIASLGAKEPTDMERLSTAGIDNHPGNAIYRAAEALNIHNDIRFYDGTDTDSNTVGDINNFFTSYGADGFNPHVIFIPGSGPYGLDDAEADTLANFHSVLEEHAAGGGALMVFATKSDDLSWLHELLPDLQIRDACDSPFHLDALSQETLPGISEDILTATNGCTNGVTFGPEGDDSGNLASFAIDNVNQPLIMTSYLSIEDSGIMPTLSSGNTSAEIVYDGSDFNLIISIKPPDNIPQIYGILAPRFYSGQELLELDDDLKNLEGRPPRISVFTVAGGASFAVVAIVLFVRKRRLRYTNIQTVV